MGVGLGWAALYLSCTFAFALSTAAFFSRGARMRSPAVQITPHGGSRCGSIGQDCTSEPGPRRSGRAEDGGSDDAGANVAAVLDIEPLLWITLLVPIVTFSITYPISIWFLEPELRMVPALHFLSTSLNHPPASCIGSFGFSVTLPAALFAVLARYLQHTGRIDALEVAPAATSTTPASSVRDARVSFCCGRSLCGATLPVLNQSAMACGLLTVLGAAGVAAFQWVNSWLFHSCAALLFFAGGLSYPILDTLIEGATTDSRGRWFRLRNWLGKLLCVVSVVCALFAGGAHATGAARRDDIDPSHCVEPESPSATCGFANWFVMLLAAFEIALFCGILAYFAALIPELRGLSLSIRVVEKSGGRDPA
jgi:hypothetical protein